MFRPVFFNFGCTFESLGELLEIRMFWPWQVNQSLGMKIRPQDYLKLTGLLRCTASIGKTDLGKEEEIKAAPKGKKKAVEYQSLRKVSCARAKEVRTL